MPIFSYKGYKPDGSSVAGRLEADGVPQAVSAIKALGIYPRDVREHTDHRKSWFLRGHQAALLPHLTRQLSILLSSGVPLLEALKSLSEENRGTWKTIFVKIRERVSAGASLSRAIEEHGEIFPDFYGSMVAAGESSGTLDRVLVRVAEFLEKQEAVRARIRMAMIYPVFMICVSFVVMSFLFTFVIPKIVKIFENTKSALPLPTTILIAISNVFVHYWWVLAAAIAAAVFVAKHARQRYRPEIDALKLRTPGGVLQSLYYSRFARTLGFLLDGGLPMIHSLELSAKAVGNRALEARIMGAAEKIAEGARLSGSIEGIPSVLRQLIATGERSGTLVETLGKAAAAYDDEFERRVQRALALLEPGMILVMGLAVGFIVLAVLLPMFQMNQLIR